jgi:hypothetical protein
MCIIGAVTLHSSEAGIHLGVTNCGTWFWPSGIWGAGGGVGLSLWGDLGWRVGAAEPVEPVVFSGFHLSPLLGGVVVVAGQVKDAMDGVAHDFVGPGGVEPLGVEQGDGDADKHLAVQGDGIEGVSMVEADDVGGVGVLEEGEVQAGDFPGIDEVDAEGVVFVGMDDALDEGVADDVAAGELDEGDPFDVAEGVAGFDEAGGFMGGRSIWVISPVTTALEPKPRRVRNMNICSMVQFWASSRMMKALVERAAAHVGERGDFDGAAFHVFFDFLGGHHVVEGVVERAQVRGDLLVEIAGEEAEGFAGLDGGSGEDDAGDGAFPEGERRPWPWRGRFCRCRRGRRRG